MPATNLLPPVPRTHNPISHLFPPCSPPFITTLVLHFSNPDPVLSHSYFFLFSVRSFPSFTLSLLHFFLDKLPSFFLVLFLLSFISCLLFSSPSTKFQQYSSYHCTIPPSHLLLVFPPFPSPSPFILSPCAASSSTAGRSSPITPAHLRPHHSISHGTAITSLPPSVIPPPCHLPVVLYCEGRKDGRTALGRLHLRRGRNAGPGVLKASYKLYSSLKGQVS